MASAIAAARRALRFTRIRYRLLLVNLIVVAVPIVGMVFAEMHEQQLLAGLEGDMIHQAQLVRAIAADGPVAETTLARAAADTRMRIRILDAGGHVIADSHRGGPPEGVEPPEPHLLRGDSPARVATVPAPIDVSDRREVKAALAGRYGSATRLWGTQERVFLFSALPILRAKPSSGGTAVDGVVYITRSTHEIKLQLYRLRSWLAKLLVVSIIGTALLTLLLATTIARPLGRLTRRAQRIANRQPVDSGDKLGDRSDEIGQLARAVTAMTEELERRAHEARTLAADISHEFKTPLTGIRGAAELLRDGAADEPDARERFLAMIVDDTARLDRVVSRLLELARVDDDRGVALPVDLAELAGACAQRPWPVPVDVVATGATLVTGRAGQLAAAIENLVANATQHAEPGTSVRVIVDGRRVTVENRGPVLSAAAQRKVWDRFYTTRAQSGGSGLGLAIVRSVALAHGGGVGVRCAGGTTAFWFEVRE